MSAFAGYGLVMPPPTRSGPVPTLAYLLNQWYFADPAKTRMGRVVSVSESYVKVEYRRLDTPGDPGSAASRPAGVSLVSGPMVRDAINVTRRGLGKRPVQWSRLTRRLARAGRADSVEDLERALRQADAATLAGFPGVEALELDDVPQTELESAISRRELDQDDPVTSLLDTVDRLMSEFEERVIVGRRSELAPQFVDKLLHLHVRPTVEFERAAVKARASGEPVDVQDAFFEAIAACVATVRQERGITSVEDIIQDVPLRSAARIRFKLDRAPVLDHQQGDLLTGAFEVVANPKLGRPSYEMPLDAIPECDLVAVARVMKGSELPDLTVEGAKAIVRPLLKSKQYTERIQGIVATQAAKRTGPTPPGG